MKDTNSALPHALPLFAFTSRLMFFSTAWLAVAVLASACASGARGGSSDGGGDGDGNSSSATGGNSNVAGDGDGATGDGDGVVGDGDSTVTPIADACGWSGTYAGPDLGRCAMGKSIATGSFLTIDDFDDHNVSIIASRDGRTGNWWEAVHASVTASMTFEAPVGSAIDSLGAVHYTASAGAAEAWAATLGVDIASCYDARAYDGMSFWFKGDPAAGHTQVKLSIHSPPTQPADTGGACTENCFDHFAVMLEATGAWVQHRIPWSSFQRLGCIEPTPAIPEGFQPHAQIVGLSFSQPDASAGVDFWVDDLRLYRGELPATATFVDIVNEATFDELFPPGVRAPVFTYAGLIEAVNNCVTGAWPACASFTTEGTLEQRTLEAAAFLAHVAHETGSLMLSREEACSDGSCSYGQYFGRGALQLTHNFNYSAAGAAFGVDLVGSPDLVATDPKIAWGTALWFWSTDQSSKGICHNAIVSQKSFGGTTSIINGIDCGGDKSASRIALFKTFAQALGVNPYTISLDCSG